MEDSEKALQKSEAELKAENLDIKTSCDRSHSIADQSIKEANDLSVKFETAEIEIKKLKVTLENKEAELQSIKSANREL